ncbi:sensor histidine kinase [Nocardioides litoris]|uniref:sensor histidine kinase n=1 Tax=Nocardioides litoris TaxID=1926648 RepID=UPI00112102FA|nr:histidine kinase [Nocardioides litoris]
MTRSDVAVSAACGTLTVALLLTAGLLGDDATSVPDLGSPAWWATALALVVQALALPAARTRPRPVVPALAAVAPIVALAGAEDATSITSLAVVVGVFSGVARHGLRPLLPALVLAGLLLVTGGALATTSYGTATAAAVAGALLQYGGTLLLTLLAASWIRAQREVRDARAAEDRAVLREQDALLHAAVARERTAMARELHDIAAHHLSAIALLAAAVERQVDRDPETAKQGAAQVRRQSRDVLRDLRRLVGLLREQGAAGDVRPETLASVRDLVAAVAASGVEVSVTERGDDPGRDVGPLAQLAAYRAVQEALANAARHAPGAACSVVVDGEHTEVVVVTVRNGPPPAVADVPTDHVTSGTGGHGLLGMRERAQLTGSEVSAGPTDDGGWSVVVRVPREPAGVAPEPAQGTAQGTAQETSR